MTRSTTLRRAGLRTLVAVAAAGLMLLGSYLLSASGDRLAIGQGGQAKPQSADSTLVSSSDVRGTVVSRVKNVGDLDETAKVITVPLGVDFETPGRLYGIRGKQPYKLGPSGAKGMTQDAFGSQTGVMASASELLYPFWVQLQKFPSEAPGDPKVPDGTHLSTPTIRRLNLVTEEDELVVAGARSMALRQDGAFAYCAGIDADYRYNVPYLQRLVVQASPTSAPEVWTGDADRYTVLQWAGESLLVQKELLGGSVEVLCFSGPNAYRTVVAADERLLATSPDGALLLVAADGLESASYARLVSLSTGDEVARLDLASVRNPNTGEAIAAISGGAWREDTVVLTLAPADLAVIDASGDKLRLRDVITFQYPKLRPGSAQSPILDSRAEKVSFVTHEGSSASDLERTAIITYSLISGECTRWIAPGTPAITNLLPISQAAE